ncbi:MAG: sulfatase [Bacteroidota bacterium]
MKSYLLQLALLGLMISLTTGCETQSKEEASPSPPFINPELPERPNILWLVAEDQSPNIPTFGDSTIETPNLSRLAAEGVAYDQFYAPHPVCAPARAAIATGMYANHISASHMRTGPWFLDNMPPEIMERVKDYWPKGLEMYEAIPPAEVRMFSEYLREAGYFCTNNPKTDYQFRKTPTAWDESGPDASWTHRQAGQPFFAIYNFQVTHESQIWAKAKDSLWVAEDLDIPIPPYLPNTKKAKTDIRRMYSNIKEMDHQVGELLKELEEAGELEKTIIVWYTDHGGPLPRQKRLLYDSGLKVPMIIRFPGKAHAGERDDRITSFIDLAATTLSMVGIKPPSYMEGTAFLGKHIRKEEPTYSFGAADRFDEKTDKVRSVRDKRYKYIRYYMPNEPMFLNVAYRNQMGIMQELLRLRDEGNLTEEQALWFRMTKPEEELFDIEADPHELNNLAKDPAFAPKLQELSSALDTWMAEHEDTGMMDESELLKKLWPEGQQPVTQNPIIQLEDGKISISSETEGASIGYKIWKKGEPAPQAWQIFQAPIELEAEMRVSAIAHRIGYLPSEEVNGSENAKN